MIPKMISLIKFKTRSYGRHRKENKYKIINIVCVHHYSTGTTFCSAIAFTIEGGARVAC